MKSLMATVDELRTGKFILNYYFILNIAFATILIQRNNILYQHCNSIYFQGVKPYFQQFLQVLSLCILLYLSLCFSLSLSLPYLFLYLSLSLSLILSIFRSLSLSFSLPPSSLFLCLFVSFSLFLPRSLSMSLDAALIYLILTLKSYQMLVFCYTLT